MLSHLRLSLLKLGKYICKADLRLSYLAHYRAVPPTTMAGKIPQRFIDDLLSRTDIVDVIDERVPLKKDRQELLGLLSVPSGKVSIILCQPRQTVLLLLWLWCFWQCAGLYHGI